MGRRHWFVLVMAGAALAVGCDDAGTEPVREVGRRVVYMGNAAGNFEVYLFDPGVPSIEALTAQPGFDGFPAFHPDGADILFASDRGGDLDIYRMAPDGTDVIRLTDAQGDDSTPVYSPDGSSIVFSSERDGDREIYIMNADGSAQTRLTDSPGLDASPFFSSEGDAVFWISERAGFPQLLRVLLGGSDPEVVLGSDELLNRPGVDPVTGRLVYTSSPNTDAPPSFDLWLAEADGTDPVRLTRSALSEFGPSVSPDGRFIAFSVVFPTGEEDLFTLDTDTGEFEQITSVPGRELWPTWDPRSGGAR